MFHNHLNCFFRCLIRNIKNFAKVNYYKQPTNEGVVYTETVLSIYRMRVMSDVF